MSNDTFISQGKRNRWLDEATRDIRCKADRVSVRLELLNHINDRTDRYRADGLAPADAISRAVDDMGDARELRRELARIHRPGWGYAHWLTRLAAIILLCCVLSPFSEHNLRLAMGQDVSIYLGAATVNKVEQADKLTDSPQPPRMETTLYGSTIDTIAEYELEGGARWANHRITVPAAWVEQRTYYDDAGTPASVTNTLVLYVKASTPLLFGLAEADDTMVGLNVIRDGDGLRYSDRRFAEKVERVFTCTAYRGRLGSTWYRLRLSLGPNDAPERLEIPVGRGGLTLRVDLEKGSVY